MIGPITRGMKQAGKRSAGKPHAAFDVAGAGNVTMVAGLRSTTKVMVPESRMRYADHIEQHGTALFQRVCEMDLEGIVAKHSLAPYTSERTTWFKIKNRHYSQMAGREELFERERHTEPVAGWHSCELACAEVQ